MVGKQRKTRTFAATIEGDPVMKSTFMYSRPMLVRVLSLSLAVLLAIAVAGCGGRQSEQMRQRGDTLLRIGQIDQAPEEYEGAIAANPDNAAAHLGKGRALVIRDNQDEALASFERAIELQPDYEAAYVEAVQLMLQHQRTEDAMALAARFAEITPLEGGMLHGRTLMRAGAREEALAVFADLRSEFPDEIPVYINSAMAYLDAGQPEAAEQALRQVLDDIDERSLPARMALIDVYRVQDMLPEAISEFRTLLAQAEEDLAAAPDDREAQENLMNLELTLARSLLEAGEFEEAEEIAVPILHEHPDSGWANYVVGACLLEREEFAEALQYLQTAARALPQQPLVDRRLTTARRGGLEPARDEEPGAERMAGARPETDAPAETWTTFWRQGRLRELLGQRDNFLAAGDREVRETLAVAAMIMRNMPLAEELAQPLGADAPLNQILRGFGDRDYERILDTSGSWEAYSGERDAVRRNAQAFVLTQLGMRAEAFYTLNTVLEDYPEHGATMLNMAFMYQAAGMPEFMAGALERLSQTHPDVLEHRVLLVGALLDANRPEEARNRAESLYSVFPRRSEAVMLLANAYVRTGDAALAVDVLKRGVQEAPDDRRLQASLAEALLRTGQRDGARSLVDGLADSDETRSAAIRVSAFLKGLEGVWEEVLISLESRPLTELDGVTRLLYAAALVHTGQEGNALDALTLPDGESPVLPNRTQVIRHALGDETLGASEAARDLAAELSGDAEILARYILAVACREARLFDDAYEAYAAVHDEIGGQPHLLMELMRVLAFTDRLDAPLAEAEALAETYSDLPEVWLGLAEAYELAQDEDARVEALRRATEVAPGSVVAWHALANYANEANDYALALECYRELKSLDPNSPIVNNNLAYFLLASGEDPSEALPLALEAHAQLEGNPNVVHTVGLAQLRLGDLEEASRNLNIALQMRPGDPTLLLDFGQLLVAQGDAEEGRRHAQWALQFADVFGLDFPRRDEAIALAETG